MRQFTSDELRNTWKQFYVERGHVDVGAVSLVSDGSTGVMFNVAGMQPLMPYLLGQKHPLGTRLCNVQGCVRTNDIDSVGDKSHVTFFEMMGSWSLGDYLRKTDVNGVLNFLHRFSDLMQIILQQLYLQVMRMLPETRRAQVSELHQVLRKRIFIIFLLRITGGALNTDPADLTVKCFILQMFPIADRTADPDVHAANIQSLVMTYLCSMKSIRTVL